MSKQQIIEQLMQLNKSLDSLKLHSFITYVVEEEIAELEKKEKEERKPKAKKEEKEETLSESNILEMLEDLITKSINDDSTKIGVIKVAMSDDLQKALERLINK
jgi:predicted nucleic acid-binding protein